MHLKGGGKSAGSSFTSASSIQRRLINPPQKYKLSLGHQEVPSCLETQAQP